MTDDQRNLSALQLYGREVKVTRYDHGGARFYIDDEKGRGLVADTYSLVATDWLIQALRKHETERVAWLEDHRDGEGGYDAEMWGAR